MAPAPPSSSTSATANLPEAVRPFHSSFHLEDSHLHEILKEFRAEFEQGASTDCAGPEDGERDELTSARFAS